MGRFMATATGTGISNWKWKTLSAEKRKKFEMFYGSRVADKKRVSLPQGGTT